MDVMIDIEALAKKHDAALVQVAAVCFDPVTGQRSHTFNGVIRNSGGSFDVDTVAWWMQQKAALALGAKLQDPAQAGDEGAILDEFCRFIRLCNPERVWAHGSTYDFPILESALARCGLEKPWHYRAPRDTRGLYDVAPGGCPKVQVDETRKHDALYDCEVQVQQVVGALKALRDQAADVERWKNEFVLAEEARESFEQAYNNLRAGGTAQNPAAE